MGQWYTVDEVRRWTEADERGFGEHAEWLAAQLNAAFAKGQQLGSPGLVQALGQLSKDMHGTSSRPCATCDFVSKQLGEPFGCYARAR